MKALSVGTLALSGTTLIEASAGTGKTYTITSLVLRLLVEAELDIDQILVVTYTRAATSELRDRIRARIGQALKLARGEGGTDPFVEALVAAAHTHGSHGRLVERLERALYDVDAAPVLTIHGFCQRVLSDHAFACGSLAHVKLTAHATPMLEEIADDYYVKELHAAPEEGPVGHQGDGEAGEEELVFWISRVRVAVGFQENLSQGGLGQLIVVAETRLVVVEGGVDHRLSRGVANPGRNVAAGGVVSGSVSIGPVPPVQGIGFPDRPGAQDAGVGQELPLEKGVEEFTRGDARTLEVEEGGGEGSRNRDVLGQDGRHLLGVAVGDGFVLDPGGLAKLLPRHRDHGEQHRGQSQGEKAQHGDQNPRSKAQASLHRSLQ